MRPNKPSIDGTDASLANGREMSRKPKCLGPLQLAVEPRQRQSYYYSASLGMGGYIQYSISIRPARLSGRLAARWLSTATTPFGHVRINAKQVYLGA